MTDRPDYIAQYQQYDIYDFLEDTGFRHYVLKGSEDQSMWLEIENKLKAHQENHAFQQAKAFLLSLKAHFESVGLNNQEINLRIDQRINMYRNRSQKTKRRTLIRRIGWSAAASILVVLSLSWVLQWVNRPEIIYQTANGEQMTVQLPDASIVHLNGNSTLVWDRHWKKNKSRIASLTGEGYFEVAKVETIPFRVEAGDVTVRVLGTIFNLNSRRETTKVFLEEGKVTMRIRDSAESELVLSPGDRVEYDAANQQIEKTNVGVGDEVTAWKDGLLIYREASLEDVMQAVSDIYGKTFVFADTSLVDRRITATIPLTDWRMSAMAIKIAMKIEFEETNDTIRITKKD